MKKIINAAKEIAKIAKIAMISDAKKIAIKEIRTEIIYLSNSSITLHVMNAMKKNINDMSVQKLQRKKKIKMQRTHSDLKTSAMLQSKRVTLLSKCFKLFKSQSVASSSVN